MPEIPPRIMSNADDHALLASFAESGSEDAFAELARRYTPLVRAAARRQLADEHLAEDITQSTMMTIMRKARTIPRGVPLGPWLLRVTHHLAIDALRSESARKRHERNAAMQRHEIQQSNLPDAWRSYESVLDQALDSMGIDDRTVLTLRYLQGWTVDQISRELDITPAATRQRLSRAVRRLRGLLARHEPRDEQQLPILPIPLIEAQPARSFFERVLIKTTRFAKSAARLRFAITITAAGAAVVIPAIVLIVSRHKAPASHVGPPTVQAPGPAR
jgi:RNA polymerase sigma factor (sigma-70 family)